jgi:hypothetical protein
MLLMGSHEFLAGLLNVFRVDIVSFYLGWNLLNKFELDLFNHESIFLLLFFKYITNHMKS